MILSICMANMNSFSGPYTELRTRVFGQRLMVYTPYGPFKNFMDLVVDNIGYYTITQTFREIASHEPNQIFEGL